MQKLIRVVFVAIPMLLGAQASAKPLAKNGTKEARESVVYRAQTRYDFDNDIVEGTLVRPDAELVRATRPSTHGSLINVRRDFVREMIKSAEDQL